MGLFTAVRDAQVSSRIDDQQLYSEALREIESGVRRDGLWAKALAESKGDENRAKSLYIELLVITLRDERYVASRVEEVTQRNIEKQQQAAIDQCLNDDAEIQRQEEIRKNIKRQQIYVKQGARAKSIGWLSVIPAWLVGIVFFLWLDSGIEVALMMATVLIAPAAGLLTFIVASLILRGVR